MEFEAFRLLERTCRLLDSFSGRDKAIRTTYFSLLLWANRMHNRQKADQLIAFARQLSRTRLVCRLFSQPSLLRSTIKIPHDWHNSTDGPDSAFSSFTTILYLLCGWAELFGWLAEAGLWGRTTQAAKWFQHSLRLWVIALLVTLIRSMRQIFLRLQRDQLNPLYFTQWTKSQCKWLRDQLIGLSGTGADFIAAVNSMPAGTLWGGKLSSTQSAGLFLLASIVGIYRLW